MRFLLVVLLGSALACAASGSAKLTFIKEFPGSSPAYVFLSVDRSGALEYREAPTDDRPLTASMTGAQTDSLFDLASKLGYFKEPIESGLKVANTGKKTFRYEDESGAVTESTFNYSIKLPAQQLLDQVEQIAASERAYIDLDRTIHFDKLGVNDALAQVESLWLRKQLAAPQQFLPLLNYISKHETFMHLARDRAARLKDEFVAPAAAVKPVSDTQTK